MTKHEAIYALYPTVAYIQDMSAFNINNQPVQYDEQAVESYVQANQHISKRAAAYPSIADQLDTLYHGGYDAWKATITAVKEEFPKP